jgi:hypothetical protein
LVSETLIHRASFVYVVKRVRRRARFRIPRMSTVLPFLGVGAGLVPKILAPTLVLRSGSFFATFDSFYEFLVCFWTLYISRS